MTIIITSLVALGIIDVIELINKKSKKDLIIFLVFFAITVALVLYQYNNRENYSFIEMIFNMFNNLKGAK